jgi:hypothetical protein
MHVNVIGILAGSLSSREPARRLGSTVQEVFGFELSVFESVSSHKNISVPSHA